MLKKLIKFFLFSAVAVTFLGGIGLFTLYKMYPPQKLKQMLQTYVAQNYQRELVFDDISFTWIGFTLTNVALSENTTLADGTFIKADKLTARVAVKPLLQKRIEISTIETVGLDVQIIQHKDGSYNFDTLLDAPGTDTAQQAQETPATQPLDLPFVITAKQIKLQDCDIFYKNLQSGLNLDIQAINILVQNFDLAAPFDVTLDFTSDIAMLGMPRVRVPVHIALRTFLANLDLSKALLTLTQATAQYQTVQLTLQGEVNNFENPSVNLTGTLRGLSSQVLAAFAPDLPHFSLPTVNLALQAQADLTQNTATLSQAKLSVQDSFLQTQGTAGWGGNTPTYALSSTLKADVSQLVKMTDTLNGFNPGGLINATLKATDKHNNRDVSGTVTLKNLSVLYEPFTLTQTNGTVHITSLDNISSPAITGKLNGENFNTSFSYKNVQDVLNLVLYLNLDKLSLKAWPQSADNPQQTAPTPAATASAQGENPLRMNIQTNVTVGTIEVPYLRSEGFTLAANLTNVTDTLSHTNGTLRFNLQPGKITDLDTFIKDSKVAKIILLPVAIVKKVSGFLGLKLFAENKENTGTSIAFTMAQGQYTFTDGVMNLDKTLFNSSVTNISASGTANFQTQALDMKATATLFTQAAPISIKITGTLDEPKGRLDVIKTVTSVVGSILNGKTEKSAVKTGAKTTQGTAKLAAGAAKETVITATDVVKGIGGLFKKKADK